MNEMIELIKRAQAWQAERVRILDEEAETGRLDHDAIQGSDDDAVEIADAVAAIKVRCTYCGEHVTSDANGVLVDTTGGDACPGDHNQFNENKPHTTERQS